MLASLSNKRVMNELARDVYDILALRALELYVRRCLVKKKDFTWWCCELCDFCARDKRGLIRFMNE